jgi:hypothetical protein
MFYCGEMVRKEDVVYKMLVKGATNIRMYLWKNACEELP